MKHFKGKSKKIEISGPISGTFKEGNNALKIGYRITQEKYDKDYLNTESKKPNYKGIPGYNMPLPQKSTRRKIKRGIRFSTKKRINSKRKGLASNSLSMSTVSSNSNNLNTNNIYTKVTPTNLRNVAPQVPKKMKRKSYNNALGICTGLSKEDCDKHDINCKYTSKCIPKSPPKTMKKTRRPNKSKSKSKSTKRVRFTSSTKSRNA